jgi:hypothetical protein
MPDQRVPLAAYPLSALDAPASGFEQPRRDDNRDEDDYE